MASWNQKIIQNTYSSECYTHIGIFSAISIPSRHILFPLYRIFTLLFPPPTPSSSSLFLSTLFFFVSFLFPLSSVDSMWIFLFPFSCDGYHNNNAGAIVTRRSIEFQMTFESNQQSLSLLLLPIL